MRIDPNGIITERLLEDYLFENSMAISIRDKRNWINSWLKRQYQLPSGRLDLLGEMRNGDLAVVELKNVQVNGDAVAQVCRYCYDIRVAYQDLKDAVKEIEGKDIVIPNVNAVLVGPSFSDATFYAAEALDVYLLQFVINPHFDVFPVKFTEHQNQKNKYARRNLALDIIDTSNKIQMEESSADWMFNMAMGELFK